MRQQISAEVADYYYNTFFCGSLQNAAVKELLTRSLAVARMADRTAP